MVVFEVFLYYYLFISTELLNRRCTGCTASNYTPGGGNDITRFLIPFVASPSSPNPRNPFSPVSSLSLSLYFGRDFETEYYKPIGLWSQVDSSQISPKKISISSSLFLLNFSFVVLFDRFSFSPFFPAIWVLKFTNCSRKVTNFSQVFKSSLLLSNPNCSCMKKNDLHNPVLHASTSHPQVRKQEDEPSPL